MSDRYIVKSRTYGCHPETCNHEEHFSYDVWDDKDMHWMNDGSSTRKNCEDIAYQLNQLKNCIHPEKNHKICSGNCEIECQRMKVKPFMIKFNRKDVKIKFGGK